MKCTGKDVNRGSWHYTVKIVTLIEAISCVALKLGDRQLRERT